MKIVLRLTQSQANELAHGAKFNDSEFCTDIMTAAEGLFPSDEFSYEILENTESGVMFWDYLDVDIFDKQTNYSEYTEQLDLLIEQYLVHFCVQMTDRRIIPC